jgi:hypothetical protein
MENVPRTHRSEAGDEFRKHFFRNEIPTTRQVVGLSGDIENQVPRLNAKQLRDALAKYSNGMTPQEIDHYKHLASEIGRYEHAATAAGHSLPDPGMGPTIASAGLALTSALTNSPKLWKVRAAYNAITGANKTNKVIDEALQDPNKFVTLMRDIQTKTEAGRPLSATETALREALLSTSRQTEVPDRMTGAK